MPPEGPESPGCEQHHPLFRGERATVGLEQLACVRRRAFGGSQSADADTRKEYAAGARELEVVAEHGQVERSLVVTIRTAYAPLPARICARPCSTASV